VQTIFAELLVPGPNGSEKKGAGFGNGKNSWLLVQKEGIDLDVP
jgi:hypothetical protein